MFNVAVELEVVKTDGKRQIGSWPVHTTLVQWWEDVQRQRQRLKGMDRQEYRHVYNTEVRIQSLFSVEETNGSDC